MNLALFAVDVWLLVLGAALLVCSWALPAWIQASEKYAPELRAQRLLSYALAPWAVAWLTVVLAFAPTWLTDSGWISDWCLTRHAGLAAACPMHGGSHTPDPLAPMLAMMCLLLGSVAVLRMCWMVRLAIGIAGRLGLMRQRTLSIDGLRVDVVTGQRALALALCVPNCRVVVSETVIERLDGAEFRALIEHERAHLARGDAYAALLLGISSMVLLPKARRALREAWHLAAEQSCDRIAAYRTDAYTLAAALIKFARIGSSPQIANGLVCAFDHSQLNRRITALLQPCSSPFALPSVRLRCYALACLPLAFTLHELGEFVLLPLVR